MPIGGFEGPSGRRVRSVERALSASTLLPTVAFAALGALTVLLVAQMGISPLGAGGGPSARDGGHTVTTPRMSISVGPPRLHRSAPARDRKTTTGDAPSGPSGPSGPTTLTLARPEAHTIPPTRGRETTTGVGPTGLAGLTPFTLARQVAHTIPPTHGRETTSADVHSVAVSAVVIGVPITDAEASGVAVTSSAVTTAAVEPQVLADREMMAASEVMDTLLTRTAIAPAPAPAPEPEDQKSLKSLKSLNEDASVTSVKPPQPPQTTQSTDEADCTEHAKAAKTGS